MWRALLLSSACMAWGCGGHELADTALDLATAFVDSAAPVFGDASTRSTATSDAASPPDAASTPDLSAPSCAADIAIPGIGGCQFYACREAEHPCGPSGYYLGFGEKYCERFLIDLRPQLSAAGQAFLDAGRDCLMHAIDTQIPADLACADVHTQALASHIACYRDNGFCALSVADRAKIFLAVDPADLDLLTALETELTCL